MTALRGGIELGLMGKRSAAEYRALLEQSLQLADTMTQLVISLRDFGESGAPGGSPRCVSLNAAVGEVVAELSSLAESRDLRLQFKVQADVQVSADQDRLREALQHLLGWVIQNSAGGAVISIQLASSEREAKLWLSLPRLDAQYLQIRILEDITNPGLLFCHAAKNGGLGWAITKRLWDSLGGKIGISTEGPEGSGIGVRLPLAAAT